MPRRYVEKRQLNRLLLDEARAIAPYTGSVEEELTVHRSRPRMVDALLACGVAITLSVVIALSQADEGDPPGFAAYLFAAGFGGVLLARRRMPVLVLGLSVLAVFVYYIFEFPQIGVALPVVAALFSAAEAGRTLWAIIGGVVIFAVALFFRIRDDPSALGYLLGLDSVVNLALIAGAVALGFGLRMHRVSVHQQRELTRLTREQAEHSARLQVQSERERISRELHDTLGHSLSVISLHAGAGSEAIGADDAAAASAFERIREQSTESLQELRSIVRLLKTRSSDAGRHVRTIREVDAVAEEARAAGIHTQVLIDIGDGALSPTIDMAAYRIVQESITNIIRHSRARNASITASAEGETLRVEITDDGVGAEKDALAGDGLTGMGARVNLLGGTLTTKTAPGEGFTVTVTMPARLHS